MQGKRLWPEYFDAILGILASGINGLAFICVDLWNGIRAVSRSRVPVT
jgi:hypothetical protein